MPLDEGCGLSGSFEGVKQLACPGITTTSTNMVTVQWGEFSMAASFSLKEKQMDWCGFLCIGPGHGYQS